MLLFVVLQIMEMYTISSVPVVDADSMDVFFHSTQF